MNFLSERNTTKILAVIALVLIMAGGYVINKQKVRAKEASSLPFYGVKVADVPDGTYHGKTYTSFLRVQLDVIVENHEIKDIKVTEADGIDGEAAKPIIQEMIKQNKTVVPAIKGYELGSLVYISCVDSALHNAN